MFNKTDYKSDIKLGEKYIDEQTGISGIASAVHFYQHGCERVTLEAVIREKIEEYSFDSPRLTHVETKRRATSDRTGGPEKFADPGRSLG